MGVTLTLFCDFVIDRTIAHGGCTSRVLQKLIPQMKVSGTV
jgi:hypothetical protein